MKIVIVVGLWILAACSPGYEPKKNPAFLGKEVSVNKTGMDGLWLESKGKYESSFVLIHNDTLYFLKGPAKEYYTGHDTLHLTGGGKFKRKIIELDSVHLKWTTISGESYTLYKKI